MHVLFVTGEYPPTPGGVGAYTHELGKALVESAVTVSVFTSQMQKTGDNAESYPQTYPQVSHWGWPIVGEIGQFAQQLRADWIHVQYQTAAFNMHPAINFAPFFWRRRGFKVAWTYHDLLVPYLFPKAGQWLRRWVTERPAFLADVTVVTNEPDRARLAGRVQHLYKIPIGSNVTAVELSSRERHAERTRLGYDHNQIVVAYFGFLNRSKGGLTLVDTMSRLVEMGRDAHLLMVGERVGASDPTNYAYLQEVESRIDAMGLDNRVQWTGRLSDAEVGRVLNAADVLLMPYVDGVSLRRGTLMAGLANGCPIVTTTPSHPLPELIDGRDLLTVPPQDAASAAQAILSIADDPILAQQLRHHARRCSTQFEWNKIADRHLELYRSGS